MIYAIRDEKESNEKLVLRYKKLFFQSRIITKLRSERYVTKKPTKRKRREQAMVRGQYRYLWSKVYF